LLSCLLLGGAALQAKDHPVEKIINLLKELKTQAIGEGKEEALAYEKFVKWCKDSQKTLNKAIAEENDVIDAQQTIIDAKTALKGVLEKQIKKLNADIGDMDAAKKRADDERTEAENLYTLTNAQVEDTIQAIKDALTALEGAQKDTDVGLLQVRHGGLTVKQLVQKAFDLAGATFTGAQRDAVDGFLQVDDEGPDEDEATRAARRARGKARRAKEAAAEATDGKTDSDGKVDERTTAATEDDMAAGHVKEYTFKSGGIIELLKQLLEKYETEHLEVNKAETNAVNAHALEAAAREDARQAADFSKTAKENELSDAKEALADAVTLKGYTEDDRKADQATLDQNVKDCGVKKMEWEKRSETRQLETDAMTAAIKIMSNVTGVRTEAPGNPSPPPSPVDLIQKGHRALSLLQLTDPRIIPTKVKAVEFLRQEAQHLHSKALETLALEVSTHLTGPFNKVNNMIEKMIFRLMAEQKDEDDHKNWCDKEVHKTRTSKDDKSTRMERLQDDIEDAESKTGKLADDIKKADDMVVTITDHMAEAKDIRKAGHDENAVALKDAQDAQKACANAIAVLTDFYKDSGMVPKESWESFVQQGKKGGPRRLPAMLQKSYSRKEPEYTPPDKKTEEVVLPEDPNTWETDYSGVADPKNGEQAILALLESTLKDFAQMEADIVAQEQTDQENFDQEMSKCTIEKARRSKESEMKNNEKKRQVDKTTSLKNKKKATTKEHDATAQYLKDLAKACLDGSSTYEDRKAARDKEIEALHQAQDILRDAYKAKGFLQKA